MRTKYTVAFVLTGLIISVALTANAQLFPYTGTSTAPTSSVVSPSSTAASTTNNGAATTTNATIPTTTIPTNTTTTGLNTASTSTGSVLGASTTTSGTTTPSGVAAPTTGIATPVSSSEISGWVQFNGLVVSSISGNTAPATIAAANPGAICVWFITETAQTGTAATCPAPSVQIQVSDATAVLLRDRTHGVLPNITAGDEINAFGFYRIDGTLQASVVRDLSKPAVGLVPSTGSVLGASSTGINALIPGLANINFSRLSNLSATVTQMNADGSFVVQLNNGQTFTVPNFIHVGQTISFQQIVNWINGKLNILTTSTIQ